MADTPFVNATASVAGTVVVASWLNDVNTNTYTILNTVAGTDAITAVGASTVTVGYPRGVAFRFLPVANNTGAVTINISTLGVKNVTKFGADPLVANDLRTGMWAYMAYDGTQFQLINPRTTDFLFPTGVLPVANGGTGSSGASVGRLIGTQTFTANGTYTPTAGTTQIIVEALGGGGAGGGTGATIAGNFAAGGGGGSGSFAKARLTSGFSGAAVTIGAAGVGALGAVGGAGGATSLAALVVAPGGSGGQGGTTNTAPNSTGGAGGLASTGNMAAGRGSNGDNGFGLVSGPLMLTGKGADTFLGGGGGTISSTGTGNAAAGFGSGGGGAGALPSTAAQTGGAGAPGILIIYEYA